MSTVVATVASVIAPPVRKPFWRPATIAITAISLVVLPFLAIHVLSNGFVRADVEALQNGDAWVTGGWLSQVVLRVVSLLPDTSQQQLVLALIAAVVAGGLFGVLYVRLRANGWFAPGVMVLLIVLALHAGSLYALTASSRAIPIYVAVAALIPAIRSLEDVGDVQSAIGLGLILPLLLLASPITTLLIIPLVIAAALANSDGRRDPRAFVAMALVAILPTIIVVCGIIGFILQARLDLADALLPYVRAYSELGLRDTLGSILALGTYAPVLIVPILYCFWPNLPEKRHVFSALAVVALPLYLAVARTIFTTLMTPMTPAVALLAGFVSWLAVVRLPMVLRITALLLLMLSAALSWTMTGFWDDPEWKAALFSGLGL